MTSAGRDNAGWGPRRHAVPGSGLISMSPLAKPRRGWHDFTVLHYSEIIMDLSADGIFQTGVSLSFPEHSADQKLGIAVWVSLRIIPAASSGRHYFNTDRNRINI